MTKRHDALGKTVPLKILFVASTGGHLAQLHRMSSRFDPTPDSLWVTFPGPQSDTLLAERRSLLVPYVRPRDLRGVVRAGWKISRILRNERFDLVLSTGAAVAVAAFLAAILHGVPRQYVESVSRVKGPSLTGTIVARGRLAKAFTQHAGWAAGRWNLTESVLSDFVCVQKPINTGTKSPRLFVTLGTIQPYRFDSVVDALLATTIPNDTTIWQLGSTTRRDLPGQVHEQMSVPAFYEAVSQADIVVTHAGVGTILDLLERGVHPVVVPRNPQLGEHVDGHQGQIAQLVSQLGVATSCHSADLTAETLRHVIGLGTAPRLPGHDSEESLQ